MSKDYSALHFLWNGFGTYIGYKEMRCRPLRLLKHLIGESPGICRLLVRYFMVASYEHDGSGRYDCLCERKIIDESVMGIRLFYETFATNDSSISFPHFVVSERQNAITRLLAETDSACRQLNVTPTLSLIIVPGTLGI